jgi:cell division protein FtsL
MNWLKILLGFSALVIAGCAAYFSVTGLGVLFSGASVAVMIMAGSLEFAKLVSASYLKQKWSEIGGFNKIYLTLAVGILMFITSLGIFGYLSNAFQQQNLKLQQIQREISVWESKITQDTIQIGQLSKQITELNQNQGKIIGDGKVNNRILKSVDNRDVQIGKLQDKIGILQDSVVKFNEKINEIKNNNIGTEREVGGFRFVAEAFGIELNTVVKFFIILIVLVFDPLAIALVIAFNGMMRKKHEVEPEDTDKTYEIYGEKPIIVENIFQKPDDSGKNLVKVKEAPMMVENSQQEEPEMEFIPNPEEIEPKAYYEDPNFDWSDTSKWIGDKRARHYHSMHIRPNL